MSDQSETVRMGEITWTEYQDWIGDGPVFVPVGSTEQHGPHLPLNVDAVIATELAERAAENVDGLVAPSASYGFRSQAQSGGGSGFPGTTSLRGDTLQQLLADIVRELRNDGVEEIVLINGHYENEYFIRDALDHHLERDDGQFIIASWWDLLSDEIREEIFSDVPGGFPGWSTEHAGVVETSLMMYFRPGLVRKDKIVDDEQPRSPPYIIKPAPSDVLPESGAFYHATHGTAEIGKKVTTDVITRLVDGIRTEWE